MTTYTGIKEIIIKVTNYYERNKIIFESDHLLNSLASLIKHRKKECTVDRSETSTAAVLKYFHSVFS